MTSKQVRVLITNDDGPPNDIDSPFVKGFAQHLQRDLGWDVRVVVPSSQKSWIGKAYELKRLIDGVYYDPESGESSTEPIKSTDPSNKPWILLEGTPATCTNIALHNIYPGEIDLVISGPNFGRNTSTAFALSSGTIGAALSASLVGKPSIALSYGIVEKPVPGNLVEKAHHIASNVILQLWQNDFEHRQVHSSCFENDPRPDLYNVNIPLVNEIVQEKPQIRWTTIAVTNYGRLFQQIEGEADSSNGVSSVITATGSTTKHTAANAGPGALEANFSSDSTDQNSQQSNSNKLRFKFAPELGSLVNPHPSSLIDGTDKWAIYHGHVSVTPLKASFLAAQRPSFSMSSEKL